MTADSAVFTVWSLGCGLGTATAAYVHPDIAAATGNLMHKMLLCPLLLICAATPSVELNYNVMAHAQKTVIVYVRNG